MFKPIFPYNFAIHMRFPRFERLSVAKKNIRDFFFESEEVHNYNIIPIFTLAFLTLHPNWILLFSFLNFSSLRFLLLWKYIFSLSRHTHTLFLMQSHSCILPSRLCTSEHYYIFRKVFTHTLIHTHTHSNGERERDRAKINWNWNRENISIPTWKLNLPRMQKK